MNSATLWLTCCLVLTIALVALTMVRVINRPRQQDAVQPPHNAPDFTVIDSGDQIDFLPAGEPGHVLGAGSCVCGPRRTRNRRRLRHGVLYVDHRPLPPQHHQPITSTENA
jgi:hypothetical protein